jgi:hypothetical protein
VASPASTASSPPSGVSDGWNDRCHPFTWTKDADIIFTEQNGHPRLKAVFLRDIRISMKFGALGPLSVIDGGVDRTHPAPQQRQMLPLLLLSADYVISMAQSVEERDGGPVGD